MPLFSCPKPLLYKLICLLLIGAVCFMAGAAYSLYTHDKITLILSIAVLAVCLTRAIGLYIKVKKLQYTAINGMCITSTINILRGTRVITIMDTSGDMHKLQLPKSNRFKVGESYRVYFSTNGATDIDTIESNQFLAFEEIENTSSESQE